MTGTARQRRAAGARVAASVAALGLLAACAGPRNALNTATSHCFRALPPARATVGDHGRLVGVRSVRGTRLAEHLPQAAALERQRLCVVAFRGPYGAGEVPRADPAGPGTYAIVAVTGDGATVLASFVVSDLPIRFRHRI